MNTREKGKFFEQQASDFLLKKGYEILSRNYTIRGGEIDIIAKKGEILSFVEVKARKSSNFILPREAVDMKKQKRMIRAAQKYIVEKEINDLGISFDVLEILFSGEEGKFRVREMNFFPDAFITGEE